jgi:membrane protein involved in colicin uptake
VETALGGSFMSVDPVLTDANTGASFNRYVYAENNPYLKIDPDGRMAVVTTAMKKSLEESLKKAAQEAAKKAAQDAAKKQAQEAAKGVAKAKTGPKTDPDGAHNKKIREEADKIEAEGGEIIAGGGRSPEKLIKTPGGVKEGRRPDIIARDAKGGESGVNVGKAKADGTPIKREAAALEDLNGPGNLPTTFVPYN